jgi:glycine/D-amino acid oxidase-like deaminating enzyme
LWWDDVELPVGSEDDPPSEADVVVVGGGYTGVAAARELARRGRAVVLLEKEQLGFGASTRNAGFVHPGLKASLAQLERRHGERGRAVFADARRAFDLVAHLIGEEGIECDYRRDGRVVLAHRSSKLDSLRELERTYRDGLHEQAALVDAGSHTSAVGFHGALLIEKGATLHPARYYAGLAASAVRAGAQLFAQTPASRLERRGEGFRVDTPRGRIEARDVLVATNGYADSLVPELRRRVIPIGSYIVATERLDPELAATITAADAAGRAFLDTRHFLNYWRLSPDGRLLWGGRASFRRTTLERVRSVLHRSMLAAYPRLRGVRLEYAWGGNVAFTFDRLPHFGRVRRLTFALGYCGSGVALSTYFGTAAAAWIAGDEPIAFAGLPFPTAPLYRGDPWFLPAVGLWFELRDRIG